MYNSQLTINKIEELLQMRGVPKARLNEYCGINKGTLNASAEKKYGLSAKILYDAADFLKCSVDYLLGRTDVIGVSDFETPTDDEQELLHAFRAMPPHEQQRLIGRAQMIAEQSEKAYQQEEA